MYSPTRHLHVNGCFAQANHNTDDISTITAKERLGENDILVTKSRRVVYHWKILKTIYERGHVGSQNWIKYWAQHRPGVSLVAVVILNAQNMALQPRFRSRDPPWPSSLSTQGQCCVQFRFWFLWHAVINVTENGPPTITDPIQELQLKNVDAEKCTFVSVNLCLRFQKILSCWCKHELCSSNFIFSSWKKKVCRNKISFEVTY